MKTYVCYKVDWDDYFIFYVCNSNSTAMGYVCEEYEKDKVKKLEFGYYAEIWECGEKISTFKLNKDKMNMEIYNDC